MAVSIYCYLKKYRAIQKHLLQFHNTNYELKQDTNKNKKNWQYKWKISNKIKDIEIKKHTHYYFDANNIKIDEKSCKNIFIYYNGYVTIKDLKYIKINSVNPLYLIFNKVNGYFE